ncbi:MAG TPA: DUF5615 family PIN-like protein [Propionibacterium sp.]|nr:DUF5615 family PIN-like protein [Propionibacterium sp.]
MRLLIDQNLPRSLARRMTDAGHAAAHTSELGLEKAPIRLSLRPLVT